MKLNNIIENLKLININECNSNETEEILNIRNEDKIRSKMFNTEIISNDDHLKWKTTFKNSLNNFFYAIIFKKKIIGGLGMKNYDKQKKSVDWAFYISSKKKILGLGASVEYYAINYMFSKLSLKKLYCYVIRSNKEVIKLHNKFGFKIKKIDKYFSKNYSYDNISNVQKMCLSYEEWYLRKNIIKKKFL